jgi:dihydrofolate reductase
MKASVFIAASVDGFIARLDNSLDWLENPHNRPGQDYGYQQFMQSVDALLMGRATFDVIRELKDWSANELPTFILTHRPLELPDGNFSEVERIQGTPGEVYGILEMRGYQHIYVDGGQVISGFLSARLLDEMIITRIPILLGRGIPLFRRLDLEIKLELLSAIDFSDGYTQNKYRVLYENLG